MAARPIARRLGVLLLVASTVAGLVACDPPAPPGPPTPYIDQMYSSIAVTPKAQPIVYGTAPAIDPTVGPSDPKARPYVEVAPGEYHEALRLWVTNPTDNTAANRPAVIWVHGGGFKGGIGAGYNLATGVGLEYAERGYVGFSIEYRLDTTSDCQWVQDHSPTDPGYAEMLAQCRQAIVAAQQDTQAVVRWLRRSAGAYGVDPNRVVVAGFSAGAVTAANVAYRSDRAGSWSYSAADDPAGDSRVQAALMASGCSYEPVDIGVGDAPTSAIASELDVAVDYRRCVQPSTEAARAAGLVAELTSYCDQAGHAMALYGQHLAATDAQWTSFLVRELRIWSGQRPPSADPLCP